MLESFSWHDVLSDHRDHATGWYSTCLQQPFLNLPSCTGNHDISFWFQDFHNDLIYCKRDQSSPAIFSSLAFVGFGGCWEAWLLVATVWSMASHSVLLERSYGSSLCRAMKNDEHTKIQSQWPGQTWSNYCCKSVWRSDLILTPAISEHRGARMEDCCKNMWCKRACSSKNAADVDLCLSL